MDTVLAIEATEYRKFLNDMVELEGIMNIVALSLTGNPNDAQDLVQETYLRALQYRDQFEKTESLRPWILKIMRNSFINGYRRKLKQASAVAESCNDRIVGGPEQVTPEQHYALGEIRRHIDDLAPELRTPFRMYTEGYKYKEIADELNLKVGTVKSRIFFSRQKLMSLLGR